MVAASNATPARSSAAGLRRSDIVLLLVLLASFSLSLIDLFGHWLANPWSRYSMVFVPLVAWVAYNEDYKRRHPRLGAVLIAVAMLIQLASAKAAILAVSRPALACGLMGYLLNRGFASKRCAVLSLFIVPIPYSIVSDLGGVAIAEWLLTAGASVFGITATLVDHVLTVEASSLSVSSTYAGLPLIILCTGLAGYVGLRRQVGLAGALQSWGLLLLCAPFAQLSAIALALFSLSLDLEPLARFILDSLAWLVIVVPVIYRTELAVADGRLGYGS